MFSIGIGSSVSTSLVKGLATTGKGSFEFVSEQNLEDLQKITTRQLQRALVPPVDVEVKWMKGGVEVKAETLVSPVGISSNTFTAVGYWKNLEKVLGTEEIEAEITVTTEDKTNKTKFPLKVRSILTAKDKILHPVVVRSIIRSMEIAETSKEKAIELSKSNNILSKYTSFIAVDAENKAVSQTMLQVTPQGTSAPRKRRRHEHTSLTYMDTSGQPLQAKEAFRQLSHTFHGRQPSLQQERMTARREYLKKREPQPLEELKLALKDEEYLFKDEKLTEQELAEQKLQKKIYEIASLQKYYNNPDNQTQGYVLSEDLFSKHEEKKSKTKRSQVVSLQKADGSWTKEVVDALGLDDNSLNFKKAQEFLRNLGRSRDLVWYTILATVWLEHEKAGKDEAALILQKGKQWIKTHMPDESLLQQLQELAKLELAM